MLCVIKKRLYSKFQQFNGTKVNPKNKTLENNKDQNIYLTIPYAFTISEKFKTFFKQNWTIKIAYTGLNKLNIFIKSQKDKLFTLFRSDIVYKIECSNCKASYVGQIGRLLKTRIDEHRNHINRNSNQRSVITEHRVNSGHDFD